MKEIMMCEDTTGGVKILKEMIRHMILTDRTLLSTNFEQRFGNGHQVEFLKDVDFITEDLVDSLLRTYNDNINRLIEKYTVKTPVFGVSPFAQQQNCFGQQFQPFGQQHGGFANMSQFAGSGFGLKPNPINQGGFFKVAEVQTVENAGYIYIKDVYSLHKASHMSENDYKESHYPNKIVMTARIVDDILNLLLKDNNTYGIVERGLNETETFNKSLKNLTKKLMELNTPTMPQSVLVLVMISGIYNTTEALHGAAKIIVNTGANPIRFSDLNSFIHECNLNWGQYKEIIKEPAVKKESDSQVIAELPQKNEWIDEPYVDIYGLDKAEVLSRLWNSAWNKDYTGIKKNLSIKEADDYLEYCRKHNSGQVYADYVENKRIKIYMDNPFIDTNEYDKEYGRGLAQRVVNDIRREKGIYVTYKTEDVSIKDDVEGYTDYHICSIHSAIITNDASKANRIDIKSRYKIIQRKHHGFDLFIDTRTGSDMAWNLEHFLNVYCSLAFKHIKFKNIIANHSSIFVETDIRPITLKKITHLFKMYESEL